MTPQWHVHLAGWLKIPWALDEDLSWVRRSLGDRCRWTSLPAARIIHSAWPAAILSPPAAALRGKTVLCQADNPPAFYLSTGGFDELAARVDLWIARSTEAEEQFRFLGLPVARVPYCVDPQVFRPLLDRTAIRRTLGLPPDAFVIGNFHRDSEGADLLKPKLQKGPDVFFEIARSLHRRVPRTVVLLAGPRRHWLLNALRSAGVPVRFAGEESGACDDYPRNILPRSRLNELYHALDVCVISSRWEGGPYSVLEALACGTAVVSSPVGTSRDVLPAECLFDGVDRAVDVLEAAAQSDNLGETCRAAGARAAVTHGPPAVARALASIYENLPPGRPATTAVFSSAAHWLAGRIASSRASQVSHLEFPVANEKTTDETLPHFDGRRCRSREDLLRLAGRIRGLRG